MKQNVSKSMSQSTLNFAMKEIKDDYYPFTFPPFLF